MIECRWLLHLRPLTTVGTVTGQRCDLVPVILYCEWICWSDPNMHVGWGTLRETPVSWFRKVSLIILYIFFSGELLCFYNKRSMLVDDRERIHWCMYQIHSHLVCTLTSLCYFLAFLPAAWIVLCQLSHHNHHFVAQKCRGWTCVQCLWTLHETPWGEPPVLLTCMHI